MPPDNAATVAPGTDVDFPQDGPNSGSGIARIGADSFNLGEIGSSSNYYSTCRWNWTCFGSSCYFTTSVENFNTIKNQFLNLLRLIFLIKLNQVLFTAIAVRINFIK